MAAILYFRWRTLSANVRLNPVSYATGKHIIAVANYWSYASVIKHINFRFDGHHVVFTVPIEFSELREPKIIDTTVSLYLPSNVRYK